MKPIETAPKGVWILVAGRTTKTDAGFLVARLDERGEWESADDGYGAYIEPTAWTELPSQRSSALTLAQRLIRARSDMGWSQQQLSEASGVAAAQISRYESGRSDPRPAVVMKLAKGLKVDFHWLLAGSDYAPRKLEA